MERDGWPHTPVLVHLRVDTGPVATRRNRALELVPKKLDQFGPLLSLLPDTTYTQYETR